MGACVITHLASWCFLLLVDGSENIVEEYRNHLESERAKMNSKSRMETKSYTYWRSEYNALQRLLPRGTTSETCNCTTGCKTLRCSCKKAKRLCGSSCHQGSRCDNKVCADHAIDHTNVSKATLERSSSRAAKRPATSGVGDVLAIGRATKKCKQGAADAKA